MGNALRCFRISRRQKYIPTHAPAVTPLVVNFAPLVTPEDEDFTQDDGDTYDGSMSDIADSEVTPSASNLSHAISTLSSTAAADSSMDIDCQSQPTSQPLAESANTSSTSSVMDDSLIKKSETGCTSSPASTSSNNNAEQNEFVAPSAPITRRYHDVAVNTIHFAIPEGYSTRLEYLGGGSYGNVAKTEVECRDGHRRVVAVKKLKDPFLDALQARRIYREIKLLQLMKHDNIIHALDLYSPDMVEHKFKDVYVVTEFAGSSLFRILRNQQDSGNRMLSPDHVKFIVYQLLRALKYIHSAKIIHRDLKPGNLALTKDCDLTVLDFGLARSLERTEIGLTQYVMTRWYRSPEVIYWNIDSYNTKADVWSVGCIAAELMLGRPLFDGEDAAQQYDMITRLVGSPDEELMVKIESNNNPAMRMVIESYEPHERVDFAERFRGFDPQLVEFLDQILVLDPERRLTVDDALSHPYLSMYSDPEDEPVADWVLDDDVERSLQQWKGIIWQEIQNFKGNADSPKVVTRTQ